MLTSLIGHTYMKRSPFYDTLFRHVVFSAMLEYSARSKKKIHGDHRREIPLLDQLSKTGLYVILGIVVEGVTKKLCVSHFVNERGTSNIPRFIMWSFLYEIIFDFFHYWMHRIEHIVPFLYQYLHKTHHAYLHPSALTTFHQNPIDLVLSNSIPNLLTLEILKRFFNFRFSGFEFSLICSYKVFVEIAGHTGVHTNATAFPQFMWLPKLFGIELHTEDHDLHHSAPSKQCNFSKRFTLWDKCFGTYVKEDSNI